jgi:hypothetical protein
MAHGSTQLQVCHSGAISRGLQPRTIQCRCQVLAEPLQVVNPLQNVASTIFEQWKKEFAHAGFHNPILVATHADVLQLLGASSQTAC